MSTTSITGTADLTEWPFDALHYGNDEAIGFELPIDSVLPPAVATLIEECAAHGKVICIAWTAPSFVLMERVVVTTDEDEKMELEAAGKDWRQHVAQDFDLIPTFDFGDLNEKSEEAWYTILRDAATKKAHEHFGPENAPVFPLCVLDDTSAQFWSSVLFSVCELLVGRTADNRNEVIGWAQKVYAPLIESIPITVYPEDAEDIHRWHDF